MTRPRSRSRAAASAGRRRGRGRSPSGERGPPDPLAAVAAGVVGLLDEAVPGEQPQVVAAGARRQAGHLRRTRSPSPGRRTAAVRGSRTARRAPARAAPRGRRSAGRSGLGALGCSIGMPREYLKEPLHNIRCEALPSHLWTPPRRDRHRADRHRADRHRPADSACRADRYAGACAHPRLPAALVGLLRLGRRQRGHRARDPAGGRGAAGRRPRCRWACSWPPARRPTSGSRCVVGAWIDRLPGAARCWSPPTSSPRHRCSPCRWPGSLGALTVTQLIAVELVVGVARVIFRPAFGAHLPDVVPEEALTVASARLQAAEAIAMLVGPGLGGSPGPAAHRTGRRPGRRGVLPGSAVLLSAGSARRSGSGTSPAARRRCGRRSARACRTSGGTGGCAPSPGRPRT